MAKFKRKISVNLTDTESIEKAIKEIQKFRDEIISKSKEFCRRMSEYGVEIAKINIDAYNISSSGELANSLESRADVYYMPTRNTYLVKTNCPYAGYVEFGTGYVGAGFSHPNADALGWEYDVNNHGKDGWFYYKNDRIYWTNGFESRPFMQDTFDELNNMKFIARVAREVFV